MNQMIHLSAAEDAASRAVSRWRRAAPFAALVLLPTLIAALYLFAVAAPQYRSEAQFVVRGLAPAAPQVGGMGQLLGLGSASGPGSQEAQSIREYLRSHDAVRALRARGVDVAALYRHPAADWLSRLPDDAPAEAVLDFHRDHVGISYDPGDNITRLSVRAFAPEDARRIAAALLRLGEERVNAFNARLFDASLRMAEADAAAAQRALGEVQARLSGFRQGTRDLDPAATGEAGTRALADQQAELDRQRALLVDMRRQLSASSPQVRAQAGRVAALEGGLASARARLAGQPQAVAGRLGAFEDLRLQQDLAAKRYEAARARLEDSRARAAKARLFIVPVVEPNLPERPVLPRPWRTTLLIFACLCLAYGIGWMLIAGVREHQA